MVVWDLMACPFFEPSGTTTIATVKVAMMGHPDHGSVSGGDEQAAHYPMSTDISWVGYPHPQGPFCSDLAAGGTLPRAAIACCALQFLQSSAFELLLVVEWFRQIVFSTIEMDVE